MTCEYLREFSEEKKFVARVKLIHEKKPEAKNIVILFLYIKGLNVRTFYVKVTVRSD